MKTWIPCNVVRSLEIKSFYTAFDITFENNFSFAGEIHNFYEIICVLEGTIGITSDRSIYKVNEKNLVIHRPMEFHRIWSEDDSDPRIMIISFDALFDIDIKETVISLSDDEFETYMQIFKKISESCNIVSRRIISVIPEKKISFQIAINELENFILTKVISGKENPTKKNDYSGCASKYYDIMKCLSDNIYSKLNINDIAKECGMSASSVKQIFHRYAGQGIMQYFRDLKSKEAMRLLNSGLSVKETALKMGFSDQNYFSTFFKKATGKSPRQYISG